MPQDIVLQRGLIYRIHLNGGKRRKVSGSGPDYIGNTNFYLQIADAGLVPVERRIQSMDEADSRSGKRFLAKLVKALAK